MSGIFAIVSKKNCAEDLALGTHYLQHRAQDYCGLATWDGKRLENETHKGLIKQHFPKEKLLSINCYSGLGCVSGNRQPVSEFSKTGGLIIGYDGNLINYLEMKNKLLKRGATFSGYYNPEEVKDSVLISKIISNELNFEKGIESLVDMMEGDFSVIGLKKEGLYGARGGGRKPLIIGEKNGSYAISSESTSFLNTGFNIVRDVEPGEIVFVDSNGVNSIKKLNLSTIKYGTFEWVYTAYPTSIIDKRPVAEVRMKIGELLAEKYPENADFISSIPNSGRWHALGYAKKSGISYEEAFVRFDYSDRSYTPQQQKDRDEKARTKLVPVPSIINGKNIIIVDDSIVRGTQTLNQVKRLKNEFNARKVHARVACPPLMSACKYGKTTKKDEDCIAKRLSIEEIQKTLMLDSLGYADISMLEKAIGISRDKLCLECWVE